MSTRRVKLGNIGGGAFGLRVALPGHDVVTEGSNPDALSFDSGWTDIVKMIQVGAATVVAKPDFSPTEVLFTDPGYQPFAEVRCRSGLRVYDDYVIIPGAYNYPGVGHIIKSDRLQLLSSTSNYDVVYAIFRIPVPAP